jgi:hypothetical protein
MNDQAFVDAFERCEIANEGFHHRDHVRLAWIYLRHQPPLDALARFVASLKRFAAAKGKPGLYHETITWAYLLLIHERMQREVSDDFDTFASENPDLLVWKPSILDRYYNHETLDSELARRTFLMPCREPGIGSRAS